MTHHTATLASARAEGAVTDDETLRDRLRAETREPHEMLDGRFAPMLRGERASYGCFLAMNRDAHAALEPWLSASPLQDLWRPTGRLEAARRDCAQLCIAEPAVPLRFDAPPVSRAAAFGLAYVLEGSRLGAKFLLRALDRNGTRNDLPTSYLEASSDAAPFAEMLRSMARETLPRAQFDASAAAARETFGFFGRLADQYETAGTLGS